LVKASASPTRNPQVKSIVVLLLAIASSVALGLWSAWLAVRSPAPVDTISLGPWQAWPNAGTPNADPYSRARLARTGEIPLGSGEGLMLLALTDDAGDALSASCDYTIAGQTPPARLWTVSLENRDGHVVKERDGVAALGRGPSATMSAVPGNRVEDRGAGWSTAVLPVRPRRTLRVRHAGGGHGWHRQGRPMGRR